MLVTRQGRKSFKAERVEGLDQTSGEHQPPYDLQANGGIEKGVKILDEC